MNLQGFDAAFSFDFEDFAMLDSEPFCFLDLKKKTNKMLEYIINILYYNLYIIY